MTRQTWTATVSAVLFVLLAAVIALVPVPYVTWSPGGTHDLLARTDAGEAIAVSGARTYPTTGQMRMTTVAVTGPDSTLSLPEVLFSYWLPSREVLPRTSVYQVGQDPTEISEGETQLMRDAQSEAVVAALRQADIQVISWPMVKSVVKSGPAAGLLAVGDLIQAVDGRTTTSLQDVLDAIQDNHVGEEVTFLVMRDGQILRPVVSTRATSAEPEKPIVGITLDRGYTYEPRVTFALDPAVGGSSAGLMLGLALTDRLTKGDLTGGRVVAGSGTLAADGKVGPVGGIQEKIAGAARDGAAVFLLPVANCNDVDRVPEGMQMFAVETLGAAADVLARSLEGPPYLSVVGCG